MNMGSTFDGMLAILQFQSQQDVMSKMMDMAMAPKRMEAEQAAKRNVVELAAQITESANKLVADNPGMTVDEARQQIMDTMSKIESV